MPPSLSSRDIEDLLDFAARNPTPDLPPAFAQAWSASTEEARRFTSSDARWRNRHEVVQRALDALEDATGEAYANPEAAPAGPNRDALVKTIRSRFDNLARERPDLGLRYPTDEEIEAGAVERARGARDAREAMSAANTTPAGRTGAFLGDLWGAGTDPLNLLTMPFGASAASGVLRTALVEGALSAASQAAIEAGTAGFKQQVDPTFSLGEAAANVGMAGAAGAVIGGGIRGAADLLALARGKRLGRDGADAVNVLEREQHLGDTAPLPGATGEAVHREALSKAAADLEAGRPVQVQEIVDRAVEPPTVENGGLVPLDPRTVGVDAERFQYKGGGDDDGVTDRLRGVTEWRPERAGVSIVYEYADGRRVVADGHQRRGLALRILEQGDGQDPKLNAVVYREADGYTPEQVRALAAAKNIAEGSGTALDAAKVLRDGDPAIVRSLPPSSALVRDAKGLAQLDGEAFGMVVNGVLPEQYGAIVGRLVQVPEMQRSVAGLLAKLQPANRTEAEAIVRQAMEAGSTRSTQASLFGDEVVQESLYLERARVLDRAMKTLRRDRTVFRTLTEEEGRIVGAGNVLDSAGNLARVDEDAAAIQALTTLANRKGALSDALSAAARRAREDGRYDQAVRDCTEAVRREAMPRPANANTPPAGVAARAADEMMDAAETQDALFQEVNRVMAAREVDVPMGEAVDADGRVVPLKRSAMDLMDEADREIEMAANLATCVFGVAAE
ncbi:MAG TPA: hypothetical protein VGE72_02975 [Azospirillum sp.]